LKIRELEEEQYVVNKTEGEMRRRGVCEAGRRGEGGGGEGRC